MTFSAPSGPPAVRPVTLITGATGGIGRALAHYLSPRHDLVLSGRASPGLDALCAELGAAALPLDLTRPETFEAAVTALGPVTNLVHNAGVVELGAVAAQAHEVWTRTLLINTAAPAELTRVLLPRVRDAQGMVVFVNSGAGLRANAGWGSYAASKHALRALADALRDEEAPHGVRVSSVYPGRIATEMQRKVHEQEGADYQPEVFIQAETVAATIAFALDAPRDASITDLSVRPGPRA
ncbi:SDR family oxidoreductase [Deinococcus navajonensis]|uniref:SDR family oxidoreductase n=1 Tax=Deinococcus navajonensis TaxID=309884 RepID=A0ABV8XRQ4_9DEIO